MSSRMNGRPFEADEPARPGPFDLDRFPHRLARAFRPPARPAFFGRPFRYFEEVSSTNDIALEWAGLEAAAGPAPEGAMVLAASQTGGRGRAGRTWVSRAGAGFWFSVVLRPGLAYPEAGFLPAALGFGVVDALRELGLDAGLKWPNDVLVRGRKIAGILVEGRTVAGVLVSAAAGVGLNWVPPDQPSGGDGSAVESRLHHPATGVASELVGGGRPPREISPEGVLVAVLGGLEKAYLILKTAGPAPFLKSWPRFSAHFVRPVLVHPVEGSAYRALAGHVYPDGSLEVITEGGRRRLGAEEVSLEVSPLETRTTGRT